MNKYRKSLVEAVTEVVPGDAQEEHDRDYALAILESDADVWRGQVWHLPDPHFVTYVMPVDVAERAVLLVDHIKSGLWLPPGGHIEPLEGPQETAEREYQEELGQAARFTTSVGTAPLMVTSTLTRETGNPAWQRHTDISLWYVAAARSDQVFTYQASALRGGRWWSWEAAMELTSEQTDPRLAQFVRKLQQALGG